MQRLPNVVVGQMAFLSLDYLITGFLLTLAQNSGV